MRTAYGCRVSLAVWVAIGSGTVLDIDSMWNTAEVDSSYLKMSEAVIFMSMNTHQVFIVVEDTRDFGCMRRLVTRRSFCKHSPDRLQVYESEYTSLKGVGVTVQVAHGHNGEGLRGNTTVESYFPSLS